MKVWRRPGRSLHLDLLICRKDKIILAIHLGLIKMEKIIQLPDGVPRKSLISWKHLERPYA